MAGVNGKRDTVAIVEIARGRVSCDEGSRQGVIPVRLLADEVKVIA